MVMCMKCAQRFHQIHWKEQPPASPPRPSIHPILILKLKTKCPPVRLNNRTDNSYASFKFRAQLVVLCSSKTHRFYVNYRYMLFSCHRLILSKQNLFFLFFEDTVNWQVRTNNYETESEAEYLPIPSWSNNWYCCGTQHCILYWWFSSRTWNFVISSQTSRFLPNIDNA